MVPIRPSQPYVPLFIVCWNSLGVEIAAFSDFTQGGEGRSSGANLGGNHAS